MERMNGYAEAIFRHPGAGAVHSAKALPTPPRGCKWVNCTLDANGVLTCELECTDPLVGAGAASQFTCGSSFTMTVSGSSPQSTAPVLPAGFSVTSAANQGTVNGATVWQLQGTYNGPPVSPTSFDNYVYGVNYPWTITGIASITPPLIAMQWNGSACVPAPPGHSCAPGQFWNGTECVQQIVFQQPTPPPTVSNIPLNTGGTQHTGGTQSSSGSSKTGYYVAAGVVAVLGAGLALVLWKVHP